MTDSHEFIEAMTRITGTQKLYQDNLFFAAAMREVAGVLYLVIRGLAREAQLQELELKKALDDTPS